MAGPGNCGAIEAFLVILATSIPLSLGVFCPAILSPQLFGPFSSFPIHTHTIYFRGWLCISQFYQSHYCETPLCMHGQTLPPSINVASVLATSHLDIDHEATTNSSRWLGLPRQRQHGSFRCRSVHTTIRRNFFAPGRGALSSSTPDESFADTNLAQPQPAQSEADRMPPTQVSDEPGGKHDLGEYNLF